MRNTCLIILGVVTALISGGCSSINTARLVNAGTYAAAAYKLTDQEVMKLSGDAVKIMDLQNRVAPSSNPYAQRLNRLTSGVKSVGNIPLNFKVYLTGDINAFATGDGSVRVYSGLMDIMSDNELMAIIGHEIGHIAAGDSKNSMKTAYLAYAGREALAATGNTMAMLSDSQLGELAVTAVQSQYSQRQEFAADEYGFNFSISRGYDPYSMANALDKLIGEGTNDGGKLLYIFSSHPDSAERAKRMREKAANYKAR